MVTSLWPRFLAHPVQFQLSYTQKCRRVCGPTFWPVLYSAEIRNRIKGALRPGARAAGRRNSWNSARSPEPMSRRRHVVHSSVGRSVGRRAEMKIYGQLAVARTSTADTSLGVLITPCGQRRRPHIVIYAPLSAVSVLIRRSIYTRRQSTTRQLHRATSLPLPSAVNCHRWAAAAAMPTTFLTHRQARHCNS